MSKIKQKRAAAKKGSSGPLLEVVRDAVAQLEQIEANLKTSTVSFSKARLKEVVEKLSALVESSL